MKRTIVDFHQDELGDWVAQLECGHTQHMRHNPPWQNRPWIIDPAERATRIGIMIECRDCGRAIDDEQ